MIRRIPQLAVDVRTRQDALVLDPLEALPLLSGWTTDQLRDIVPDRVHYRLFLVGVAGESPLPHATNSLTGETVPSEPWGPDSTIAQGSTWHPWRFPREVGGRLVWSGVVHLDRTLTLSRVDTLDILPGTTIRMGPDVSLITHGPVRAVGTEAAPIRFEPADAAVPWGAVALQGPGANRSEWRWVEFRGGGGAEFGGVEYVGMVNVHRAEGVLFEHSRFADNRRSDDTFRALHSDVRLLSSVFERANSDAIDFDLSRGEIVGNRFSNSGGDAIDLMTSDPRVVGNTILRAGDKGISVGEASHPVIVANLLRENLVGVEVKDGSEPVLYRNRLEQNGVAIRASRKNWRYAIGGWPKLAENLFADNGTRLVTDTESRMTTTPVANNWVETVYGVTPGEAEPLSWHVGDTRAPLIAQEYGETFPQQLPAWHAVRGIRRIEFTESAMAVSVRPEGGEARLIADFEATTSALLVLEVHGRDLLAAEVAVDGSEGSVVEPIDVDSTGFQVVTIPLPPGRYHSIRLSAHALPGLSRTDPVTGLVVPRYASILVRRLAVYPMTEVLP